MAVERSVLVRLRAESSQFQREVLKAAAAVRAIGDDIDTTNDRTAWLTQGMLAIGPAAVTAGATAVPVLMGIATQATIGAGAVGTMVLAFQGVGDALKAVNKYELEPTAKNLAAMNEAMAKIGPDGADFVRFLDDVGEKLSVLQMDSRAGMFPGMTAGIEAMLERLPDLRMVVSALSEGVGQLSRDFGEAIAGSGMDDFFTFLKTDAQEILVGAGRTLGNFAKGFGELIVAFAPMTKEFTSGLLDMSRGFEQWAAGLDETDGFKDFIAYIRDNGPDVLQMFKDWGQLFVELTKAAAPVGAVMVPALEGLADALSLVADTPAGSFLILATALTSLYGRIAALRTIAGAPLLAPFTTAIGASGKAARATVPTLGQFGRVLATAGQQAKYATEETKKARSQVAAFGKAAGPAAAKIGLLGAALSPLPEQAGLTHTAMGALAGSFAGPWGIAVGTMVGLMGDFSAANSAATDSIRAMQDAIDSGDLDTMQASLDDFVERNKKYLDGDWTLGDTLTGGWNDLLSLGGLSAELDQVDILIAARDRAREAQQAYNTAVRDGGRAAYEAKFGIDELVAAMRRQQDQARTALDNQFAWGQAVQNVKQLMADGSRGFNEFTKAGQDNFAAISGLADSLNAMVDAGELTNREYVALRDQFMQFAIALGAGKDRALEFANELLNIPETLAPQVAIQFDKQQLTEAKAAFDSLPREVQTDIEANGIPQTSAALEGLITQYGLAEKDRKALITLKDLATPTIGAILARLREVKDKEITVRTTWQNVYAPPKGQKPTPAVPQPIPGLDIPGVKKQKAAGGLILGPGGPTDDLIPAMLSNREFVINAAAVQHYGIGLFDALNERRLPSAGSLGDLMAASGEAVSTPRSRFQIPPELEASRA